MATVTINRGTIEASDLLSDVPEDGWRTLLSARRSFVKTHLPYDCRELLRFVEEGQSMCCALGYEDVIDLIKRGLDIDPELVDWAVKGLRALDPDEPVTLERAVTIGRHGGAREGAGRREGRPNGERKESSETEKNQPSYHKVDSYGTTVGYTLARLDRDNPELAAAVRAGRMSSNAAAIEAGWRKPPNAVTSALAWVRRMNEQELYEFENKFNEFLKKRT